MKYVTLKKKKTFKLLFSPSSSKVFGMSLFTSLNVSSALGYGWGQRCVSLAVEAEGDLSAEQGFDGGIERRIRIWIKFSSEVRRTCVL